MELVAKLTSIVAPVSGVSQTTQREWVRGGFVVETEDSFPRNVYFTMFGQDKIDTINSIAIGSYVRVVFHLESREYQDRWYTDARCDSVSAYNGQPMPGYPAQPMQGYPAQPMPGYGQPMPGYPTQQPMQGYPTQQPMQGAQMPGPAVNATPAPQPAPQPQAPSMPQSDEDLPF